MIHTILPDFLPTRDRESERARRDEMERENAQKRARRNERERESERARRDEMERENAQKRARRNEREREREREVFFLEKREKKNARVEKGRRSKFVFIAALSISNGIEHKDMRWKALE